MSDTEEIDGDSGENERDNNQTAQDGDEILRSLGIPMSIMVYCPDGDVLLRVTDRLTAVGLCRNFDEKTTDNIFPSNYHSIIALVVKR